MKHEVDVYLFLPRPDAPQAALGITYDNANVNLRVSDPDVLARWLAYLFERRDSNRFLEPDEETMLPVGECAGNLVSFGVVGDFMTLLVSPKTNRDYVEAGFHMEIPRDLLDDLADGLAREHRRWIEHPLSSKEAG